MPEAVSGGIEGDVAHGPKACGKRDGIRLLLLGAGASLCLYGLCLSWTPMCLFAGGLMLFLFSLLLLSRRKRLRLGLGRTFLLLGLSAACSLAVVLPVRWCTGELPRLLGTNLAFSGDVLESPLPEETLKQLRQEQPKLYEGVKSIAGEEKSLIWKSYLREISLTGNAKELFVARSRTMAESGWLELMYRYGIFILCPFLGLWIFTAAKAAKERSVGLCTLFLGYHLAFLTLNIEKPFLQPLWILAYLGIGYCFRGNYYNGN